MNNQEIKKDKGKLRLTLVPTEIIRNIASIREFGVAKYGKKESWKSVEPERYRDAMFRHMLLYLEDPYGLDEESGLPHLWHLACNVAFLCELEKGKFETPVLDLTKFTSVSMNEMAGAVQHLKEVINKNPIVTLDADGFDWKEGDYVSDGSTVVENKEN